MILTNPCRQHIAVQRTFLHHTPRYLEQQGLLEQLEGLLNDAFACIVGTDSDKAAEKALRRQGFLCAQHVYQAAYDHLQVRPEPQGLYPPALVVTALPRSVC